MKKKILSFVPYACIAALIFAGVAVMRGLFSAESLQELFGILSDCLIVPGVLLGGIGAIGWIATSGVYDMLGYGVSHILSNFHIGKREHRWETYYDYKVRKTEKRAAPPWSVLITGGCCLAGGILSLIVYLIL